jgi:outer membrane protein OmpA-like peptidoglycan-associated protein
MSYTVTVQPSDAHCVVKSVFNCKVSGLTNGKTYLITLSAIATSGETISSVTASTSTTAVVAKTIVLTVSGFGAKSGKLTKSQLAQILSIAQIIKSKKAVNIRLDGYTDNVGTTYVNARVAYVRVKIAVAQLMLDLYHLQWRKCHFSTFAHGDGPFVASNATSSGKSLNRRVQFTIILP